MSHAETRAGDRARLVSCQTLNYLYIRRKKTRPPARWLHQLIRITLTIVIKQTPANRSSKATVPAFLSSTSICVSTRAASDFDQGENTDPTIELTERHRMIVSRFGRHAGRDDSGKQRAERREHKPVDEIDRIRASPKASSQRGWSDATNDSRETAPVCPR
jgi:hypothetical protein